MYSAAGRGGRSLGDSLTRGGMSLKNDRSLLDVRVPERAERQDTTGETLTRKAPCFPLSNRTQLM